MAGIELGVPYYIYNPALSDYAAMNIPSDAKFVGYVSDISGLDMAGVRENAQVVVAGDGGYHGPFWMDRRPWTMTGFIVPPFSLLARDQAQERLEGIVAACLKSDGFIIWTPADGIQKILTFRCQQPVRITTGQSKVEKMFQIACVTADWRIRSNTTKNQTITHTYQAITPVCVNNGNCDAAPKFVFTGPIINPYIRNTVTNKGIYLNATFGNETVTVDLTGPYPTVTGSVSGDDSQYIDPLTTDWSVAVARSDWNPNQTFLLGTSAGNYGNPAGGANTSTLTVYWQDSWI